MHINLVFLCFFATLPFHFFNPTPAIWNLRATQSAVKLIDSQTFVLSGCGAITFTSPVIIGNQGEFQMIVDTGSTTVAIASTQCDSSCSSLSPLYTPSGSGLGTTSASYSDGSSWSGEAYSDLVVLSNSTSEITSSSPQATMRFAAILTSNQFFSLSNCFLESASNHFQGIFGLAFANLAAPYTNAAIDKMSINEFTLQLCRSGGNFWVYHYDAYFIAAPFQYVPITTESYYVVTTSSLMMTLPDTTIFATNMPAIVDSGTTNLVLPQAVFNAFVAQIYASPAFQSAFNSDANFFTNGFCLSTSFTMQQLNDQLPKWNLGFSNGVTLPLINAVDSYLSGYLYQGTQLVYCPGVSAQSGNAIILGFAFMNQFTTRFDIINARIGFAPTAHCGQPATLGPHFNVTVWGDCTSNDCSGQGTQNSLNSTCVYENGTAAISPSVCANQTQTFTRYCDDPTRPSSCAAVSNTVLILIIVFAIVGLVLAFFLFYQFYGRIPLPNNIAARRPV